MDLERSPLSVPEQSRGIIKAALRRGSPIADALRTAGVPRRTWRTWVKIGEDELARCIADDCDPEPHLAPYVEFVIDSEQARSEGINVLLDRVWRASDDPKYWMAASWLLERMDHQHFGRRIHAIEVQQDDTPVTPPDVSGAMTLIEQRLAQIEERRQLFIDATSAEVPMTEAEAERAT
jgi:hypothetical protein